MSLGRTVGTALLALVDALAAAGLLALLAVLAVPVVLAPELPLARVVLATAAVGFAVSLLSGFVLARRGGNPFPMARLARTAVERVPWWV